MIHILLQSKQEAQEMSLLLNRALNTLERHSWPVWAQMLVDKLETSKINDMAQDSNSDTCRVPRVGVTAESAQTLT